MARAHPVECDAPPDRVWALIARPDRWSEWSPYVLGAEGLGSPEVVEGSSGSVVLRGGLRIPARIGEVESGRSWAWRVGGLEVHHLVAAAGAGSLIEHRVEGSAPAWSLAALAYAPVVGLIARNIARVAERGCAEG